MTIAEACPVDFVTRETFKCFRSAKRAVRFLKNCGDSRARVRVQDFVKYTNCQKDRYYVVRYVGRVPRSRRTKLSPARVIFTSSPSVE